MTLPLYLSDQLGPVTTGQVVSRAPFCPRAVVKAGDLAAGLLDRQRQDRRADPGAAGGNDRFREIDFVLGESGLDFGMTMEHVAGGSESGCLRG
jgi:hypothetical protein